MLVVRRDWEPSTSVVPSGVTVGYSTRFVFEPKADASWNRRLWQEPALFGVNTVLFPLTYLRTPPFTWREYPGLAIPASHTAQPLLPPSDGSAPADGVTPEARDDASYPPAVRPPVDPRRSPSDTPGLPDVSIPDSSD